MVLLTITPLILEALKRVDASDHRPDFEAHSDYAEETTESPPVEPQLGNPLTHGQIIDLSRSLKASGHERYALEVLLKGCRIYVPPPKPKPEPVRFPMQS